MNKILLKNAIWSVLYASTQQNLSPPSGTALTPYDSLIIKSSSAGTHLTVHPSTNDCDSILEMDPQRSVWHIQRASWNQLPAWMFKKQSFCKFMKRDSVESVVMERRNLRSHPAEMQECMLVQDLIDLNLGFQGTYIKRRPGSNYYAI